MHLAPDRYEHLRPRSGGKVFWCQAYDPNTQIMCAQQERLDNLGGARAKVPDIQRAPTRDNAEQGRAPGRVNANPAIRFGVQLHRITKAQPGALDIHGKACDLGLGQYGLFDMLHRCAFGPVRVCAAVMVARQHDGGFARATSGVQLRRVRLGRISPKRRSYRRKTVQLVWRLDAAAEYRLGNGCRSAEKSATLRRGCLAG